jgi:hypothetical protein
MGTWEYWALIRCTHDLKLLLLDDIGTLFTAMSIPHLLSVFARLIV